MNSTPPRAFARTLLVVSLVLAAAAAPAAVAGAAPKQAGPVLVASSGADGSRMAIGAPVHLAATGLDAGRSAVLYKGRWSTDPQFRGWEYVYYVGVSVTPDGTFDADELQSQAGTFRFQICQYYEGARRNTWVCSNYAEITVG